MRQHHQIPRPHPSLTPNDVKRVERRLQEVSDRYRLDAVCLPRTLLACGNGFWSPLVTTRFSGYLQSIHACIRYMFESVSFCVSITIFIIYFLSLPLLSRGVVHFLCAENALLCESNYWYHFPSSLGAGVSSAPVTGPGQNVTHIEYDHRMVQKALT